MKFALFAVILIAAMAIPGVSAAGQQCDERSAPVSGPADLSAQWCSPGSATVGSTFLVVVNAQVSGGGTVVAVDAPSTWTYNGCSLDSVVATPSTAATATAVVRVLMNTDTCTIYGNAIAGPVLAPVAGIGFLMAVYDVNDKVRHIEIDAWPALDVASWPILETQITQIPTLAGSFTHTGSVEVTGIEAAINGNLNFHNSTLDAGGAAQSEFVDNWVPLFFYVAVFLWGGYTRQNVVLFAGFLGILSLFVPGLPVSLAFVVFLAVLAAFIPTFKRGWDRVRQDGD